MKNFLVVTHEKCIVEYEYVIEAANEYDAARRFINESGFNPVDHQVITDLETIRFDSIKEIAEAI